VTSTEIYLAKDITEWKVVVPIDCTGTRVIDIGLSLDSPVPIDDEYLVDQLIGRRHQECARSSVQRLEAGSITPTGSFGFRFWVVDETIWNPDTDRFIVRNITTI
jgi:hypothetical protein